MHVFTVWTLVWFNYPHPIIPLDNARDGILRRGAAPREIGFPGFNHKTSTDLPAEDWRGLSGTNWDSLAPVNAPVYVPVVLGQEVACVATPPP